MIARALILLLLAGCSSASPVVPDVPPERPAAAEGSGAAGAPAPVVMDPAGIQPVEDGSQQDPGPDDPEGEPPPAEIVEHPPDEPEAMPGPEPEPAPTQPDPAPDPVPPAPTGPTDVVLWAASFDRDFARTMTAARAHLLVRGPGGFESTAVIPLPVGGAVDVDTPMPGPVGALLSEGRAVELAPVFGWDQASGAAEAPWFGQDAPDLRGMTIERLRVHGTVAEAGAMALTWEIRGQP